MPALHQTARPLTTFLATDATSSSFASLADQFDDPLLNGITIATSKDGIAVPMWILLFPIGVGADNDAFDMRLVGWNRILPSPAGLVGRYHWSPVVIGQFSCTMCAFVGKAGGVIDNTYRYCDTITITSGFQGKTTDTDSGGAASRGQDWIVSPVNDLKAYIKAPIDGFERLSLYFDQTTNTPSMNALYRFLEF